MLQTQFTFGNQSKRQILEQCAKKKILGKKANKLNALKRHCERILNLS